jgi:heme-degrading monooxygenase HmoA
MGISYINTYSKAEDLLASQEGFCSMELIHTVNPNGDRLV